MSKSGLWQLLCGLWLLFLPVYLVWGGIAQAGLYYWVGTLEVDRFGGYDPMMTGVVPGLLLALPALVFLGREARRLRSASAAAPAPAARSRRPLAISLIAVGAVALAAAIAFYFAAQAQPDGSGRAIPFDPAQLGAGLPPTYKVRIMGTADDGAEIRLLQGSRGSTWTLVYAVFRTAGDAGNGTPPRLFVERHEHHDRGRNIVYVGDGAEEGYLVADGLPPLVRYAFAHRGVTVPSPHYLLRTGSSTLRTPYYVGAALTTLLFSLLTGFGTLLLVVPGRGGAGGLRAPSPYSEGRS